MSTNEQNELNYAHHETSFFVIYIILTHIIHPISMFEHQILHCAQFTDQSRDLETISIPVLHTLNPKAHAIQSNSFIPNIAGVCK